MKTAFAAMLTLAILPGCAAKSFVGDVPRITLNVDTSNLDLSTDDGVDRLAQRIKRRINSICGTKHEATMGYVMGLEGIERREACIDTIDVSPRSAPVLKAYEAALALSAI